MSSSLAHFRHPLTKELEITLTQKEQHAMREKEKEDEWLMGKQKRLTYGKELN